MHLRPADIEDLGLLRAQRFFERLGFRFVESRRFGDDVCAVYRIERASWQARRGWS